MRAQDSLDNMSKKLPPTSTYLYLFYYGYDSTSTIIRIRNKKYHRTNDIRILHIYNTKENMRNIFSYMRILTVAATTTKFSSIRIGTVYLGT